MKNQLRWAGHVVRMEDERVPKQLLNSELMTGKRPQHKPKKRFKDCIKNNLKAFKIPVENWETLAKSRSEWRQLLKRGAEVSEKERIDRAELKRTLRKGNMSVLPDDVKSWKCEICARILLSKAGYVNHKKLPSRPADTTCVICSKKCKTTAGLKWHMVILKKTIPFSSSVNPVTSLGFICHVCHRPCKSAAGLKSHLRVHGRNFEQQQ
ncbi:PR domain zinc finger protein 5-like [Acropora millepora]|uniref:PR domain zinc finger protein 5-like n=1 Tax=Acropora millepora TaxID=45264 RepID=UPI001CF21308|nr:PR domain zinc finger protein 5-like [Acropora millepora]